MRANNYLLFVSFTVLALVSSESAGNDSLAFPTPADLGATIFSDKNLSLHRTQACVTCHMPNMGLSDHNDVGGSAVSRGDDGISFGDRNAPTVSYARFSPEFHKDKTSGLWVGGQFWDGRAATLEDQAGGPPLNPLEMGMPDIAAISQRIVENPDYVTSFKRFYGGDVFDDPNSTFTALKAAVADFERTKDVSPFDSRYDRYLRGEVKFTTQEELGRTLFFSTQFANCNLCHDIKGKDGRYETSTFSSYQYFNIGVPKNQEARQSNGMGNDYRDPGLAANPQVGAETSLVGAFKVPSLRNVAVTGPYMHNGVFKNLRTVISFYNHYNAKSPSSQINPETGRPWDAAAVDDNLAMKELTTGPALDAKRVDALVAFLKTLTDKRYEYLLK